MNHYRARPISKTKSQAQRKENGWNDRFYLGKIPHYGISQRVSYYNEIPLIKRQYESGTSMNYSGGNKSGNSYNYNRTLSAQGPGSYKLATSNYPLINQSREMQYGQGQDHEHENDDSFTEAFSLIQNLWDDLGVNQEYMIIFEEEARRLNKIARQEFLNLEKQSLKRFRDNLLVSVII